MTFDDIVEWYAVVRHAKKAIQAQKKGDVTELPEIHQELFGRNKSVQITVTDIDK